MNSQSLEKILVVDDEPDINTIAKISLESFGKYSVETCSSGVEALKKAEWFEPNLILLDMMMPFMDGEETLKKLKRNPRTSGIPVVFVTAKIMNRDISRYKELGAADVITKPFDPVGLPDRVRSIWKDVHTGSAVESEIASELSRMKTEFIASMSARLSDLRTAWAGYLEDETLQNLSSVHEINHKIVGLSGTLELHAIYQSALKIEAILQEAVDQKQHKLAIASTTIIFNAISELGKLATQIHES